MKQIFITTPLGYTGEVKGLRVVPITNTPAAKLVGVLPGGEEIVIGNYETSQEALKVLSGAAKQIMSPTINPVYLQFLPDQEERGTKSPSIQRVAVKDNKTHVPIPVKNKEED